MIKLPNEKYVSKHNDELSYYAKGWNTVIENIKRLCKIAGDKYVKETLVEEKEYAHRNMMYSYESMTKSYFEGRYDCIVEIERLNELNGEAKKNENISNNC